ncbi:sigma-70 family RNA polymerase sigma factor [Alkalibacterium olivapovliticus]|uniref:RNA polymerase sigma factor for flagellar operon FliA n=1 Tax=Alkalibacterium olivapovliticus TaxID=99907 RepID=A0A2T0VYZ2_9LACT|nr:FliA/WhiG family RNA polymerase sigma factor [Alkalibacterium olivapovliticus]PRY77519.1 RNA polymerase sigma factor for flagellar operon FliA [Alkalibacterium olivapovliticus]
MEEHLRNEMVIQYMPLVHKVVHGLKINNKEYEHEDLVNIGVIGLMKAIEKYNDSLNVPFINYAYMRIKGAIIDDIRKTSRVSRNRIKAVNDYYAAVNTLQHELLRTPTELEVCQKLGVTKAEMSKIYETVHQLSDVSLDDILFEDSSSETNLMEVMTDKKAVLAEDKMISKEQFAYLKVAIKMLSDREQQILQLIYFEELSMKEVGFIYDISTPRVSQIHGKALLKLREALKKEYAHD